MSLTIKMLRDDDAGGTKVTVDRRLWLTADRSRAVEDGDPEARFLLCAPGKRVLRAELEAAGVKIGKKGKKGKKGGKKRDKAPTGDKSHKGATEDKGGIPGNVEAAEAAIAAAADAGELDALEQLEASRVDGPRTGVTKALEQHRADLES